MWKIRFEIYKAVKWLSLRLAPPDIRDLLVRFDEIDSERLEKYMRLKWTQ